ncbi:MAG TPA: hypothetical protein VMZ71_15725, partial [Gemmataceae bacterium]|nr:hypothetical protein [Gemmataceae bacterium]
MRIPALFAASARLALAAFAFAAVLAGCGKSQPAEPPAVAVVAPTPEPVVVPVPAAPAVEVAPQPTPVPAAPPAFAFPADVAGEAVAKVVSPAAPPPLPTERLGAAPKTRPVPLRVMEPDTGSRTAHQPPRIALPASAGVKPVAPPERLPVEIGVNAQQVPAKPKLPDPPLPTSRARDVNAPPDLPVLGRPVSDRASLDDPTVEAGHAA